MAQTTILAAGQTAATSTDVVVAAGATVTLGAFVSSGIIPALASLRVYIDTPGADTEIGQLRRGAPLLSLCSPGTYRVVRDDLTSVGVDVGVFTES